jgi:vacuole morphology and inheritance protein 14
MVNVLVTHSQSENPKMQFTALVWVKLFLERAGRGLISMMSNILIPVLPCLASDKDGDEIKTIAVTVNSHLRSLVTPEDDEEEDPVVRVMTEAAVNEPVVEDGQEEQHEPSEVEEEETEPRKATSVLEQAGASFHKMAEQGEYSMTPPVPDSSSSSVTQSSTIPRIVKEGDWIEVTTSHSTSSAPKKVFISQGGGSQQPQLDLSAVLQVILEHTLFTSAEIRTESLRWLVWLHQEIPKRLFRFGKVIIDSLMDILTDSSEEVIPLALRVICLLCTSEAGLALEGSSQQDQAQGGLSSVVDTKRPYNQRVTSFFKEFLEKLLVVFSKDQGLLEVKGSFIIRHLCLLVESRCVYCSLAEILKKEKSLQFASVMIRSLNIILLTSPELFHMRMELRDLQSPDDWRLFTVLYQSWCHNPVATVTLCLLTQNYEHASELIENFNDINVTASLLGELDRLVQLLESPIFTFLRLQILHPLEYPDLVRALYGILMLLPQSQTFSTLQQRLACIPALTMAQDSRAKKRQVRNVPVEVDFTDLVQEFKVTQQLHYQLLHSSMPRVGSSPDFSA